MTIPVPEDDAPIRLAMEYAGPLFVETRTDVRLDLGSEGPGELAMTRSRGVAAGTRDSLHVTEPSREEFRLAEPETEWIRSLESSLTLQAERTVRGITGAAWSARIIAFSQRVWVTSDDGNTKTDVRQGCRAEVKAWIKAHPNSASSDDAILGWEVTESPGGLIAGALERADRKRSLAPAPSPCEICAVLAPGVGGVVIHELVGHALEGDVTLDQETWIRRTGLPRARRSIGVIDDPRRGRGAWRVDDEGEGATETVLVEAGRPVGLLLDRDTAAALGKRSTGHGRRASYLAPPRPRMGCTFMAAGEDDPHDVLLGTRSGVFIRRVSAGHTDPFIGCASFVVSEADRIVDGMLGAPLAPFVIELDGREVWGSIDRVGHDLAFDTCVGVCIRDGQPLAVSVGAPTIRIGVMRVAS